MPFPKKGGRLSQPFRTGLLLLLFGLVAFGLLAFNLTHLMKDGEVHHRGMLLEAGLGMCLSAFGFSLMVIGVDPYDDIECFPNQTENGNDQFVASTDSQRDQKVDNESDRPVTKDEDSFPPKPRTTPVAKIVDVPEFGEVGDERESLDASHVEQASMVNVHTH